MPLPRYAFSAAVLDMGPPDTPLAEPPALSEAPGRKTDWRGGTLDCPADVLPGETLSPGEAMPPALACWARTATQPRSFRVRVRVRIWGASDACDCVDGAESRAGPGTGREVTGQPLGSVIGRVPGASR